uniref:Chalcone/stilbene synthase N-terminal domain-containing protein n=1 Tax=Zea mays TaxID=4577 RepID=B6TCW5_MAIZE|nr:hypothetical protein [Zea mays]
MTDTGSTGANGKSQGSRGKAMLLALGKGFPDQVLPQEKVAESYLQESSCDDPDTRAKLERLCTTTTVRTRYTVMSKERNLLLWRSSRAASTFWRRRRGIS